MLLPMFSPVAQQLPGSIAFGGTYEVGMLIVQGLGTIGIKVCQ